VSNVTVFNNDVFGALRTIERDGEIWFVGKEVAEMLGYSNARNAVVNHVDSDDKLRTQIEYAGQRREVSLINESGLYSLILSSKLPAAKDFKRWVTSEVLPSIRKTGNYKIQSSKVTPEELEVRKIEAQANLNATRSEQSKLLLSIADTVSNELYKETLKSVAVATLTGKEYLPLPKIECNYHTTTELATILSKKFNRKVSANIVGRLTTKNNLKTEEYAVKVWDKAKFSNKQIESYRYKDTVIEPLCKAYEVYLQIHS
jgi:prophage antirepressor-like protein